MKIRRSLRSDCIPTGWLLHFGGLRMRISSTRSMACAGWIAPEDEEAPETQNVRCFASCSSPASIYADAADR